MARETGKDGYQQLLKEKIQSLYPECFITKLDPHDYQGVPDLLILFRNKWAILEVKGYEKAPHQPNQDYYVKMFDNMSFSMFAYPENEEEVLERLHDHFIY